MKLLLFALVAALAIPVATARAASAIPYTIYVLDQSAIVPQAQVQQDMVAFQAALSSFWQYWGRSKEPPSLVLLPPGAVPPLGAWTLTITDSPDCWGCYGFHDVNLNDVPYAQVGTDGVWTSTFTHELYEMLSDPWINYTHTIGKRHYLIEVGDPVEDDTFNYTITWPAGNPVAVSDFVTPAWYRPHSKGPWDFALHTHHPYQILCGGFVSWELPHGLWGQIIASDC